jgi:hypothetical protein
VTQEDNRKAVAEVRTILKERIDLFSQKRTEEQKKRDDLKAYPPSKYLNMKVDPLSALRTSTATLTALEEIYGLLDSLFDFALQASEELEELRPLRAKETRKKLNKILGSVKTLRFMEYLVTEHQEPTEKVDDSDKPED